MYHPHADEMTQMAMGMMGLWITHPKGKHPLINEVDRDYAFLLAAYDIEPGAATPKVMTMLDFNLWTWNSRIFPGIDALVAQTNERVRIRVGNLTMTNHPIHLHGPEFEVTGTDGGPIPKSARWPEVTTDVAVGQMRQLEVVCTDVGDWALHCHKSHHTMNAMGHGVPTLIGVDHTGLAGPLQRAVPDLMVMGERGMHDMTEMSMPLPDNTAPMMAGQGPLRRDRHGRHVQRAQGARPPAGRLEAGARHRLVPPPGRYRGDRMDRPHAAGASRGACAGGTRGRQGAKTHRPQPSLRVWQGVQPPGLRAILREVLTSLANPCELRASSWRAGWGSCWPGPAWLGPTLPALA